MYIPHVFRQFQGFSLKDIKDFRKEKRMELHLERLDDTVSLCRRCGEALGSKHSWYFIKSRHLKCMGWRVDVITPVEKRRCIKCKKIRAELIPFLCPETPHITQEMAWWIHQFTEVSAVLSVSRLESIDKNTCYRVDKGILKKLLQGFEIPKVTEIGVDEVHAKSKKQRKKGETRDDEFFTVIVDLRTHKVIYVSYSRRKEALDEFFQLLGEKACKEIKVVATDQHEGYGASVREFCPKAAHVWDRFHLVQNFNEALNEERKTEFDSLKRARDDLQSYVRGKFKYIFQTKAENRSKKDREHIMEVIQQNKKFLAMELIKERVHMMFNSTDKERAKDLLCDCYDWALQMGLEQIKKWIWNIMDKVAFWNYFDHKRTTSVVEGINRAIKGLKWQAYGYKDMEYFALKIMQKCGYLNYRYYLASTFSG